MSYPDPIEAPDSFGDFLKSQGLHLAQTVFGHYQNRPIESNGRFHELSTLEWCERMDALLVSPLNLHMLSTQAYPLQAKLTRLAGLQPIQQDVVVSLNTLCTNTVVTFEGQLESQKQSDAVEAKRREEEAKARAEEEKARAEEEKRKCAEEELRQDLAQAAAARERLEEARKLADTEMAIMQAERDLRAQKQAFIDAKRSAGINVDDVDDDERSDSAPEEQPVRFIYILVLLSILITLILYIREPQRRRQCVRRKKLENGCPK